MASVSLRIHHQREVNLKPMVKRGGKEIDCHRPQAKKLLTHLMAQRPFGAQDLGAPTERVGQDIQSARNELGKKVDGMHLIQAKDRLCYHVESRRTRPPFLLQVQQGGGVVGEQGYRLMAQKRKETVHC